MPFIIVRDDLTKMAVDAVVNTTNVKLQAGSGGVSGAIYAAAGEDLLRAACEKVGGCAYGSAIATPGFHLPAGHIIHTPSMVWRDGLHGEEESLRACYRACLRLAADKGFESLAFPLIGSGAHGYPKPLALTVATQEINGFLLGYEGDMTIYLAVFGHRAFALSKKLADEVQEFIDDHYVDLRPERRRVLDDVDYMISVHEAERSYPKPCMALPPDFEIVPQPTFAKAMIQYIDSHRMTDPEVYKNANITKQNFYKIKTEKSQPKKATVLALCVSMQLSLEETVRFLELAGYALSPASQSDVIVKYFISRSIYNVAEINTVLFDYKLDKYLLGGNEK